MNIKIDEDLKQEILHPGHDKRWGINLIARPPSAIKDLIIGIQNKLKQKEPDQYYYPASNLHLTVLEVCSECSSDEVHRILPGLIKKTPPLISHLKELVLKSPCLEYDAKTCVLAFGKGKKGLLRIREGLMKNYFDAGVKLNPRYLSERAHITFMRYTNPLKSAPSEWFQFLSGTVVNQKVEWAIDKIWLTYGVTWYGMKSRIKVRGPYFLGGEKPVAG
ncbi:MAG: hypothetical protein LHV69_04495 [Elusimicrobia bacterium]|nr:hypothetical protein [Candidatus Obscuribacterium magneticum]